MKRTAACELRQPSPDRFDLWLAMGFSPEFQRA